MVTKADFLKQLFDGSTYSSDIDYASAETGMFNLPEIMEDNSARKSPIVETVAKAVKSGKARRPVHVSPVPDIIQANIGNAETMYDPAYMSDTGSSFDNVRDVAAGMVKIPTTAAKSIADVSALLTNDYVGRDASNFFGRVNEDIDNTLGSERLRQSRAAFNAVMNDPNKNIGDMAIQLMDSPRAAVDYGITQFGTMLPIAGASKGAELAAKAAKYGPEAVKMIVNAAAIGTNALMNAANTFGDENMQKAPTLDRYSGAAVSGLMALMSGIVTGGGAEGQIARKLIGDVQTGKTGALNAAFRFAKSVLNEGGQEAWEEGGNVLGNYVGTNGVPDFNNASKQMGFAGALGAITGGGTHSATQTGGNQSVNPLAEYASAIKAMRDLTEQAKAEPAPPSNLLRGLMKRTSEQENPFADLVPNREQTIQSVQGIPDVPTEPVGQKTPIDAIIANGGINRDVLKNDLGWTDEELARLPQGVVSEKGTGILAARRSLKQNGFDTDINSILDTATRYEMPEADFAKAEEEMLSSQEGRLTQENQGTENTQDAISVPETQEQADAKPLIDEKTKAPLEFSGDELGGMDIPIDRLKIRAANYARKHFADKTVTVASDGANVLIPWQGIKHALTGQVHPVAAIVASRLDSLIKNGVLVKMEEDRKGRPDIKAAYFYDTPIRIGGKDAVVRIVVREHDDGKRYYDHFKIRSNASAGPTERVTGAMSGSTAHQPNRSVGETPESNISENPDTGNQKTVQTGDTERITEPAYGDEPVGEKKASSHNAHTLREDETDQGIALLSGKEANTGKDGLGIEEVQRIADELAQEFKNAPELVVVEKASDLPFDAPDDAKGSYRGGRCYLVAVNINTSEDAKSTFTHEVIGHYGINGFFGDRLASELDSILIHNKNVQEAARKWINENQDFIKDTRERTKGTWSGEKFRLWRRRRATEEALTSMAEKGQKVTGVKKLVYLIQKLLRALGLGHLANKLEAKTDAEALMALHKAELFVKSGKDIDAATAVDVYAKFARKGANPVYEQQIDEMSEGKRQSALLGMPSEALLNSGVANVRMRISKTVVDKVTDKHDLSIDQLKALPGLLESPVMVFKSATDGGHVVVVNDTAVAEDGKTMPVVVAIRPNGDVSVNYIRSVYARRNFPNAVMRWVESGLLISAQKKAAIDLVAQFSQRGETSATSHAINNGDVISLPESTPSRKQNDDSIDLSRKDDEPAAFSRKKEKQEARGAFTVPDITLGDAIVRTVQDDNYDLKRVQDAILEQGGVVTDRNNAYQNEEEYLGKTKARLEKFTDGRVSPILETIRDSGVSLEDASRYALARHVLMDKVNEKLKAINPDRKDNEALSGMSDADARAILKEHGSNPKLKELGEAMDKLASFTRATMVSGGLITDETYKHWENAYQHYVPLHRDLDGTRKLSSWQKLKEAGYKPWNIRIDGQSQPDAGKKSKGFEVRGEESKRRMGSNLDVSNVIVNAIAQAEGAIIRAEKAKVTLSLLDLAKANPNPDFWTVDTPALKKRINPETGLVEHVYRDPNMKPADNVLVVKEAGRERWIKFHEDNKRAMEIAKKFRNLDAAAMNWAVESIGDMTRWMAGWLTQKNPIFMFFNFQRDIQHAVFNLSDTPIAGKERHFLKNVPLAMKGYWDITRSNNKETVDNDFASYAREFREAGAETGFIKSFESISDRITDVEKELKKMSRGKGDPRTWMAVAGRAVEDYNAIIENGVRLASRGVLEIG